MKKTKYITQNNGVEIEDTEVLSKSDINEPFDPKKIDITTKQMILEAIFRRLRNHEIDLNTFFQRGMDLWDKGKQSRLIESILIRLPLPAFYFDGSEDNKWLIVDGLQRISTFQNFIIDKNFSLQNLEYLIQFNNCRFDELPRELQRRIEEHEITVYIINPGTPEEVKYNLFRRINTGGLTLTAQEIRHAINQGIPSEFIIKLASQDEFRYFRINPRRMLDKDFVTRFIAFYIHTPEEYKPDLDTFLNASMSKIKGFSVKERNEILSNFKKALIASKDIFGDYAFRKRYSANEKRKPINKALFEVLTTTLAKLDNDKISILVKRKNILNQGLITLLSKDLEFEKSITTGTGDRKSVEKRYSAIQDLVERVLK